MADNLMELERTREAYWRRYPGTSPIKLRWRALTVRHWFHVLPGESLLEVGAGTGIWTEHLSSVLRHENEITAAVFNPDFARHPLWQSLRNVHCRLLGSLDELPAESFDYIVGTAILCHDRYQYTLKSLYRLLKPGGKILFFENNFWNPQVFMKSIIRPLGRWAGNARCQIGLRRYRLVKSASQTGLSHLEVVPYDIIHPLLPRKLVPLVQSLAFIFEHMPIVKELCGTLYISAQRPGGTDAPRICDLATIRQFQHAVSFVVPCHNEEANVRRLVQTLIALYDAYIHEIIIVNDNSQDRTADITREISLQEPRVKLLDRKPPNGVGRALRDGYAAATGQYIFTMDGDFVHLLPEFRDLFEAVASDYDGAFGSRFTQESIMVNYPFFKILCNRAFHLLAKILLPFKFHDVSNNLKLFRADVLKQMVIEQPHFAANAEIGLKPLAAGYRIREVPISWINRTIDMGNSSFRIAKVAPNYFSALMNVVRSSRRLTTTPARERQIAGGPVNPQETIPCPVCREPRTAVYLDADDEPLATANIGSSRTTISYGKILRCPRCTFGFRRFRPTEDQLASLYRDADDSVYDAEREGRARVAASHARLVSRFHPSTGRLLDIGCASGTFLSVMVSKGWEVEGVEPSREHFATASESLAGRARLQRRTLQEAQFSEGFDIATAWDVLEHVPDPVQFLSLCGQLVKSGGYLLLNVPDLDSLQAYLLGRRWPLLLAEHLNYFNLVSLRFCAEQAGLRWLATGRRSVFFSLRYISYRLSQHSFPLAGLAARRLENSRLGHVTVPIRMGERFAVLQRQ